MYSYTMPPPNCQQYICWLENLSSAPAAIVPQFVGFLVSVDKVITTMVIRPLDDPTRCAQSVDADLQPLHLGYVGVGDGAIR